MRFQYLHFLLLILIGGFFVNTAFAAKLPAQCPGVIGDYNVILGSSAGQTLDGTAGKDFIDAGGGDDIINGNGGDDCIDGGSGDDTITTTSGNDVILDNIGANIIGAGDGNNTIESGSGDDTITTTGNGINSIDAGGGTNIVTTGDGADTVTSGNGEDTINSGGGNDIIDAGGGTNIVNAGGGDDTINADGASDDTIHGNDGDDTINDTGGGNDTLYGDNGNDTIIFAGNGNDSVFGGSGDDTITENPVQGGTDSADGGPGCDVVSVNGTPVPDSDCAVPDVENTAELCADAIDNDGDGFVDLTDPDCAAFIPSGDGIAKIPTTFVAFSGRAFPGAKMFVVDKSDTGFERTVNQNIIADESGFFQVSFANTSQKQHSFGLLIKDKDNRATQTKFFNIDTLGNDLIVKDILVPPTIELLERLVSRGQPAIVIGSASPNSSIVIEIDDKIKGKTNTEKNGSYKISVDTGTLEFGTHYVRVKQIDAGGRESDYSLTNSFAASHLVLPKTDLNDDGSVDIKDWSMFLSNWGSKDENQKKIIDLNGDGKISISDFSIFIRTIKK